MSVSIGQVGAGSPLNGPSIIQGQEQALPGVSAAGEYRIYMDSVTKQLMLSEDGGAYAPFTTGALALSLQGAYNGGVTIDTSAFGDMTFTRAAGTPAGDGLLVLVDANVVANRAVPLLDISDTNSGAASTGSAVQITRTSLIPGVPAPYSVDIISNLGGVRVTSTGTNFAAFEAVLPGPPTTTAKIDVDGDTVLGALGVVVPGTERLLVVSSGVGATGVRSAASPLANAWEGYDNVGAATTSVVLANGRACLGGSAMFGGGAEQLRVIPIGPSTSAIRAEGQVGAFLAPDANPISALDTTGVRLGPGGLALDLTMSRLSGLSFEFNVGARFGGNLERLEAPWTISTIRAAAGAGDNITLKASDGVGSGALSFSGGVALLASGDGGAGPGGTSAPGANVIIRAGSAIDGGPVAPPPAAGGDLIVEVGNGAAGGAIGNVIFQNRTPSATPWLLPRLDTEGKIGTRFGPDPVRRWAEVNAVMITAGAYYEEETFDEESLDLKGKLAALSRELDEPSHPEGLRHLARIAMVTARTVLDLGRKAA